MKSKRIIMTLAGLLGITLLGVQLMVSKGDEVAGINNEINEQTQIEETSEVNSADEKQKESGELKEVEEAEGTELNMADKGRAIDGIVPEDNEVAILKGEGSSGQESSASVSDNVTATPPGTGGTTSTPQKPTTSVPNTGSGSNTSESNNFMAEVEQAIFNRVNEERSKAGLSNLSYSSTMEKYARIKSKDMGDNNYFSHEDLNGNLITTKMQADGVYYNAWAENIAYIGGGYDASSIAEQFMTNWMNSSGHRANILSSNFNSIGVGVYKIGNQVYATQEFFK